MADKLKSNRDYLAREISDYFDSVDDSPHDGVVTEKEFWHHLDFEKLRDISPTHAEALRRAASVVFANGGVLTRQQWVDGRDPVRMTKDVYEQTVKPGAKAAYKALGELGGLADEQIERGLDSAEQDYQDSQREQPQDSQRGQPQENRRVVTGTPQQRFALADTNHDGKLSIYEERWFFYPPEKPALSQARMRNADPDGKADQSRGEVPTMEEMAKYFGVPASKLTKQPKENERGRRPNETTRLPDDR